MLKTRSLLALSLLLAAHTAGATRIPRVPKMRAQVGTGAPGMNLGTSHLSLKPTLAPSISVNTTVGNLQTLPATTQDVPLLPQSVVTAHAPTSPSKAVPTHVKAVASMGQNPQQVQAAAAHPQQQGRTTLQALTGEHRDFSPSFDVPLEDAAAETARLFDNTLKSRHAAFSTLGFRPNKFEASRMDSNYNKVLTEVYRQQTSQGSRVVKYYQKKEYAANELAHRRLFQHFPQLRDLFDIPQTVGYRTYFPPRGAGLIMEDMGPMPGTDTFAELPLKQKVGLALAQTFGMSDLNPGAIFIRPMRKPVLLDLEHLGFPRIAPTGRSLASFVEMPWVSAEHLNDPADYMPAVRRWVAEFNQPQNISALRRILRESGMGWWRTRREIAVMRENLENLEQTLRADIRYANLVYLDRAMREGKLDKHGALVLSEINKRVLAGEDEELVRLVRLLNEHWGFVEAEFRIKRNSPRVLRSDELAFALEHLRRGVPTALRISLEEHGWEPILRDLENILHAPATPPIDGFNADALKPTPTVSNWEVEPWWLKILRLFS
jgi:hypothetical protein